MERQIAAEFLKCFSMFWAPQPTISQTRISKPQHMTPKSCAWIDTMQLDKYDT